MTLPLIVIVPVVVAAFATGMLIGIGQNPAQPALGPSPHPTLAPTQGVATFPGSSGLLAPAATLTLGLYHVTPAEAVVVDRAVQFFTAYNAAQLDAAMSLLSPTPQLVDCDYRTQSIITVDGRLAISAYLLTRFADSDTWTVEFYNENPGSGNGVGVVPLRRSNDTLKGLGLANGTKLDFPVNLVLALAADGTHFGYIDLAGSPSMCKG